MGVFIYLMLKRRYQGSVKMNNNVTVLTAISKKGPREMNDVPDGDTLSPSRSVAIALPGFLKLDLL
jgi:hypothetical protein